ncbi:myelin-oligodendrocyte glycoprotein-like isoform X2 [Oreochromis aureus]|uniref:myelin-oligodendrocyte glycoprotein-like isoform X2 n=1 Tax=Oreochromis aureus TaxID=47969 RepID=UPI0019534D07|nr:myelin-oligodendrocyte glycoprotein-like isoform X2 [Oreochromis aureus]
MDVADFRFSVSLRALNLIFMLFSALTPVEAQFHVVGSRQPIITNPGDDVILPCYVEPKINVAGLTVEWSRPDRRPDPNDHLSRVEYVHLYRHNREMTDMKLPSYFGRTALFKDGLREGNISLRITNVTQEDEGRYRCFVPKLKSQTKSSIVHLIVAKTVTTETPLHPETLQTPDLAEEFHSKGGLSRRSRLIPLVVFCGFILLCVAVAGCWFTESKRQKTEVCKRLKSLGLCIYLMAEGWK